MAGVCVDPRSELRLHRIFPELAESGRRKDLTGHRLSMTDGVLPLPAGPGLGIELNRDPLAAYRSASEALGQ